MQINWLEPLIGGALIGLAASGMLWANGRIMGVSGIFAGLLVPGANQKIWRFMFLLGLVVGSLAIPILGFTVLQQDFDRNLIAAVIGGLFVGVGTTIGNGCTSGHGVCGISRMSPRSIVATLVFMCFGFLAVLLINTVFGVLK